MASSPSSLPAAPAAAQQLSATVVSYSSSSHRCPSAVSFPLPSKPKKLLLVRAKGLGFCRDRSIIAKVQLNEVLGGSSSDAISSEIKAEVPASNGQDAEKEKPSMPSTPLSDDAIAEFMTQVASLVKLVDSRDIAELHLKQNDCELLIRKKEALPQPPAPAPVVMMQTPAASAPIPSAVPPLPPVALALPSPAAASLSAPLSPGSAPKASKSSHPPLKSPMAGTFYRSPGPGIPPFVKPGDEVNKGQILCIIEAMKLMNEIEADKAGTVVEILVEDAKPVSTGQPIFVIEP